MIKTNQNMKENPPISFHIDQVQLQAFQTHLVDSKSFFFNDELSFIVRNNSPFYASIFDLMIQINGYQNIDEFRILSFNFSHSDSIGSNFQNTTSFLLPYAFLKILDILSFLPLFIKVFTHLMAILL